MNILPSFKQQREAFEAKHCNSRIALKLKKSLYGLKQAPRNWYKLLTSMLKGLKLEENQKDPLFISTLGSSSTLQYMLTT
jgi:hypothetical protein